MDASTLAAMDIGMLEKVKIRTTSLILQLQSDSYHAIVTIRAITVQIVIVKAT